MPLSRRSGSRFTANIWPGFVDAMTALLLVLFFVLSIFMIVQFVLRDRITEADRELDQLSGEVAQLARALGLEQQRADELEGDVQSLGDDLSAAEAQAAQQAALIATLSDQRDQAQQQIATFEEQVAGLLAQRADLESSLAAARSSLSETETELAASQQDLERLRDENAETLSRAEALQLALARARDEVDAEAEAARLAAARREALEALVADLQSQRDTQAATIEQQAAALSETEDALSEAEQARLVEAEAARALRERLENSSAELTAMTLQLEQARARAEETLTLLAAARAARDEADAARAELAEERDSAQTLAEQRRALLELARQELAQEEEISSESQRRVELLNQQTAALSQQLRSLQALLDEARAEDEAQQVRIENLGQDLNTALARVAAEQRKLAAEERRRRELEEAERQRLEAEAKNLENYRSEFFGRVREILGDREGIEVVGDRFVFSSEVLFARGSAELGDEGRHQLSEVAAVIREIRDEIPAGINWILRVDGHTDNIPISGARFADNWELSQARALSVVRYLIDNEDIPPERLAANGFGEYQPIDPRNTPEARARNRRIELKFTER
ncbi:peptidoglycan -binding protein [Rhodobacteraceae bacterium 2CG4]|uniref:Peptidoglycan-binding protein n=1 Tax=Halovulum marinum TaxID=2662447 RepID=A0A6L5Z6B6_9RHOB|nr:peptidoglycan -binding protein [Halovulum marinum]MSU92116.1 peptidoglycan -binding protein [Halovulum marinum]